MSTEQRGKWLRLNTTWSSSDWVAELLPESRLCWVELMCYVKAHGIYGKAHVLSPTIAARQWGVSTKAVIAMLDAATSGDEPALAVEDGYWCLLNWARYQPDPTAAKRMRRYRERTVDPTAAEEEPPNKLDADPAFDANAIATEVAKLQGIPTSALLLEQTARSLHTHPVVKQQLGHQITHKECLALLKQWRKVGRPAKCLSLIPGAQGCDAPWGDPYWLMHLRDGMGLGKKSKRDEADDSTNEWLEKLKN